MTNSEYPVPVSTYELQVLLTPNNYDAVEVRVDLYKSIWLSALQYID
jgi:hypothetical protein